MSESSWDDDDFADESDLYDDLYDTDDSESETRPCPECGSEVYEESIHCPHCGLYITFQQNVWSKHSWPWIALGILGVLAVILILLIGY